MINLIDFNPNNKDLNQINQNTNLINDKNIEIKNNISLINNYNKINLCLMIISNFEKAIDTKIDINDYRITLISRKLNQLGINNVEHLLKEIDKRITDDNEKQKFYKELNELLDVLLSQDLDKKLHPEVIKAINNSYHNILLSFPPYLLKEFPTLRDFSKKLALDLLQALSNPNSIRQEYKGTCSQTVIERAIAERIPSEYVKIVKDLITKGEYATKSGKIIRLNSGGIKKDLFEIDNRYLTTRIIAPSFMEFANGKEYYYDDKTDYNYRIIYRLFIPPTDQDNILRKYQGNPSDITAKEIFGTEYRKIALENLSFNQKINILKTLVGSLKSKKYPIFLYTYYGQNPKEGLHAVELKQITDTLITVSNPWGQIETYTIGGIGGICGNGKYIDNPNNNGYSPINNFIDFINRTTYILLPSSD